MLALGVVIVGWVARLGLGKSSSQAYPFPGMNDLGKFLVIAGVLLVALGLMLWTGFGKGWVGRLPGDIHYTRGNFTFYFPLVTGLLVSFLLTLILWLFKK